MICQHCNETIIANPRYASLYEWVHHDTEDICCGEGSEQIAEPAEERASVGDVAGLAMLLTAINGGVK